MSGVPEVTLGASPIDGSGGITVPVYPQRVGYLTNKLGGFFERLTESGGDLQQTIEQLQEKAGEDGDVPIADMIAAVGGMANARVYDLVCIVVPNVAKRMPEWQFRGFDSQEAMDRNEYVAELDRGPSVPEVRAALTTGAQVSDVDVFGYLKGAVKGLWDRANPQMVGRIIDLGLAEVADRMEMTSTSTRSADSPSSNGGSEISTSSSPTSPTSTPTAASPSHDSEG
jgi:hypothetical protein